MQLFQQNLSGSGAGREECRPVVGAVTRRKVVTQQRAGLSGGWVRAISAGGWKEMLRR